MTAPTRWIPTARTIECTRDCLKAAWLVECGYRLLRERIDPDTFQVWQVWVKETED